MKNDVKRRGPHQIAVEILEAATGGAKKTHIMYTCELSYHQLAEYLPLLIKKGFLEEVLVPKKRQTTKLFKTSNSGKKFIEDFRKLELFLTAS